MHVAIKNSVLCSGNGFNCYGPSDEPPYNESIFIYIQPVPYTQRLPSYLELKVSLNKTTAHFLKLYIIPLAYIFHEGVSVLHTSSSVSPSIPELEQSFKDLIFSFPIGYHLMNQNDQFSLPVDLYCITRHHKHTLQFDERK